jgi:hypothetical protein
MLPRVGSHRISVSIPPTRRVLRTGKRWSFSGWKGCRTSAHPKDSSGTCVVRANRRDDPRSVVQTAAMVILEPIFKVNLPSEQYAYRDGRSALDAVREVHRFLSFGHREVPDAVPCQPRSDVRVDRSV